MRHPHGLPGKDVTEIHLPALEADPAAAGDRDGLVVKRVGQVGNPRFDRVVGEIKANMIG